MGKCSVSRLKVTVGGTALFGWNGKCWEIGRVVYQDTHSGYLWVQSSGTFIKILYFFYTLKLKNCYTKYLKIVKKNKTKQKNNGGTWVARLVKRLTLDFGSGHDLTDREFEAHFGLCAEHRACLGVSLSLSLPLSCLCMCILSLSLSFFLSFSLPPSLPLSLSLSK